MLAQIIGGPLLIRESRYEGLLGRPRASWSAMHRAKSECSAADVIALRLPDALDPPARSPEVAWYEQEHAETVAPV